MTDFEASLRQTLVTAYDNPRDAPSLASDVVRLYDRRRTRRRLVVPLVVLLVVVAAVLPFAVRGGGHRAQPVQPGPPSAAATSSVVTPSPVAPPVTFAQLSGWWRFTALHAPGGTVPILKGMPAYLHFDSPTAAAAEIGNNTTSFGVALAPDRIYLAQGETSAVPGAAGENDVESFLSHLTGAASAIVTGDGLVITGPDGARAALARTTEPANPSAWTCCEPTTEPPAPVAPAGLPACEGKDLTGEFFVGAYQDRVLGTPTELLVRTTSAAPCTVGGPITTTYASAEGPVTPDKTGYEQAAMPTVAIASSLTVAQDADPAWTSALPVWVTAESTDGGRPCPAQETRRITTVTIAIGSSTVAVPVPGGLLTCDGQVSAYFSTR